jgi:hypothetical protein
MDRNWHHRRSTTRIPRLIRTDGSRVEARGERTLPLAESTPSTDHRHVHWNSYGDDSVVHSNSFAPVNAYNSQATGYGTMDSNGSTPTNGYNTQAIGCQAVVSNGHQPANIYNSQPTRHESAASSNGYASGSGYTYDDIPRYTSPEPLEQYSINWLAPEITVEDIRWACARRVPPIHISSRVPTHEIKFRYGAILMGLAPVLPEANNDTDTDTTVVPSHRRRRRSSRYERE